MNNIDLESLLLNIFIEDYSRHNEYSYQSQITILTIKSLTPSMDDLGVRIDYKRFTEELNLWSYYRIGENSSLLNIGSRDPGIYWNSKDDSILSRIIPILLSNQDYGVAEEEIIKNILFITGNLRELFESVSIAYLIYLVIEKEEDIVDKLKEKIIGFGQLEFIYKYEKYYMTEMNDYPGNYRIDFEKEKIYLINLLNGIDTIQHPCLTDCMNVLNNVETDTFMGNVLNKCLYNSPEHILPRFYISMGDYIIKLRKSRVDPVQLQIKEYILPNIFSFNEGDVFFHSLLRESKVIKKEIKKDILTSLVQTKTGMYLFKQ